MKKWRVAIAVCVLALAGCASYRGVPSLDERSRPQVTVRDGRIVVSPEILYFFPEERDVAIVWQLPRDSKYRFPTDQSVSKEPGIVIEGRLADRVLRGAAGADSVALERQDEIVDCKVGGDGLEFTCLNRHRRPGVYKYTIRVVVPGSRDVLVRDPPFVNM